jgi:hypothetical protein
VRSFLSHSFLTVGRGYAAFFVVILNVCIYEKTIPREIEAICDKKVQHRQIGHKDKSSKRCKNGDQPVF